MTKDTETLRESTLNVREGVAEFSHQRPAARNALSDGLRADYTDLLDRIERRAAAMFAQGLLEETAAVREQGLGVTAARAVGEPRYELVEVKAPGDKLQDNQIRWLDYCVRQGLPVSVCHVQWRSGVAAGEGAA